MTGIYEIWIGDKFYQGRSINMQNRVNVHLSLLKKGIHKNTYMQGQYNKIKTFEWHVLIECNDVETSKSWEQDFIDTNFGLPNCMNLSPFNSGGWTKEATNKAITAKLGKPRSDEVKKKLSEANKGHSPSNKGKKFVNGRYV